MKKIFLTIAIGIFGLLSYAQVGSIENIHVEQRDDGTGMVDIHYDLIGVVNAVYMISIEASFDSGVTFSQLADEYLTGDLEVSPAEGLHIIWDGLASHPNFSSDESMLKLTATLQESNQGGTVTDIDGNVYQTIIINGREWMAENLKVTKYRDESIIRTNLNQSEWNASTTLGAMTIYNHANIDGLDSEEEVKNAYGALYNFAAVIDARGLCPVGWSVPTREEWADMVTYIIDEYDYHNDHGSDTDVNAVGNSLKSCRQVAHPEGGECETNVHPRWNSHHTHYGFDQFGFGALPGGRRWLAGFADIGNRGFHWTSTEGSNNAYTRIMYFDEGYTYSGLSLLNSGHTVRCIKDLE